MIYNIRLGGAWARYLHIPSNNPSCIFIPGNLQEIESVEYFNQRLAERFNLFVLEPPGTGLTPPLHASKSFEYIADCVSEFAKARVQQAHHLCVFSYATPIAVEYLRKYAGKLLSVSMGGSMGGISEEQRDSTMEILADIIRDKKVFAASFIDGLTKPDAGIERHKAICRAAKIRVSTYTDNQIQCFKENTIRILAYQAIPLRPRPELPITCFTGACDPYVKPSYCKKFAEELGAQFELIPNTDHLFHLERPDATATALMRAADSVQMVA